MRLDPETGSHAGAGLDMNPATEERDELELFQPQRVQDL